MSKILLLIPSLTGVGGTERMVDGLARLLGRHHEVALASFDAADAVPSFSSDLPFHPLGVIPRLPLPLRGLAYAIAVFRLRALKRRLGTDLTISNLWGADLISLLSTGSDRKICLAHINVRGNPTNGLMLRLRPLVAWIYRRADRVIGVSEPLARELSQLYRLSASKVTHIDNFMDRPHAQKYWQEDHPARFVWCGRMVAEKNVDGLIHVWTRFTHHAHGVQLVLLGDGPLLEASKNLAHASGLSVSDSVDDTRAQIVFAGRVNQPANFMLGTRALLLTSHSEGLPMVLLEALSLGLPVVASDCPAGGVRSAMVSNGETLGADGRSVPGWLLPIPRDTDVESLAAWEHALCSLLDNNTQVEAAGGALVRARAFSSERIATRWEAEVGRLGGSS